MSYELICADNLHLVNGEVKAVYEDKDEAVRALFAEVKLAKAEHGITDGFFRIVGVDNGVAIDFGSWSDFVGLTNVTFDEVMGSEG